MRFLFSFILLPHILVSSNNHGCTAVFASEQVASPSDNVKISKFNLRGLGLGSIGKLFKAGAKAGDAATAGAKAAKSADDVAKVGATSANSYSSAISSYGAVKAGNAARKIEQREKNSNTSGDGAVAGGISIIALVFWAWFIWYCCIRNQTGEENAEQSGNLNGSLVVNIKGGKEKAPAAPGAGNGKIAPESNCTLVIYRLMARNL